MHHFLNLYTSFPQFLLKTMYIRKRQGERDEWEREWMREDTEHKKNGEKQ